MATLPKEKRNHLILVILGGLLIAAALYYGLVLTGSKRLSQGRSKLAATVDKVEKAKARVKQAERVDADMESALRELRILEDELASNVDLYSWSLLLMDKARAGQEVEIIEVTRPQTNDIGVLPGFPYLGATFNVRGSAYYADFGKFLADFENRFPYYRAQNITLSSGPEMGSDAAATRLGKEKLLFKMDVVVPIKPAQ